MQNTAPAVSQTETVQQNISVAHNEPEEAILELARGLSNCAPRRTSFTIPARLKQFMEFFQSCYEYFDESTKAQVSTSQTAEWLLDNF